MARASNIPHAPPAGCGSGFTLIEIAIVLVIIGLIVGGVLVGRDLVKQAELRSVITEYNAWETAVNTFAGKYGCVPGDCPNATALLGNNASLPPSPAADVDGYVSGAESCDTSTPYPVCNGNGDHILSYNLWGGQSEDEELGFWQQLSIARLVPGYFIGTEAPGEASTKPGTPGINVPQSKLSGACWFMGYNNINVTGEIFPTAKGGGTGNYYDFGAGPNCGGNLANTFSSAMVTAPQAQALDSKIDDGLPGTGIVTAQNFGYTNGGTTWNSICYTGGGGAGGTYLTGPGATGCVLFFYASSTN